MILLCLIFFLAIGILLLLTCRRKESGVSETSGKTILQDSVVILLVLVLLWVIYQNISITREKNPDVAEAVPVEEEVPGDQEEENPYEIICGRETSLPKNVYHYDFEDSLDTAIPAIPDKEQRTYGEIKPVEDGIRYEKGMEGHAVFMTGASGLVLDGISSVLQDKFTISFWFCPMETRDYMPILHVGRQMEEENSMIRFRLTQLTDDFGESIAPVLHSSMGTEDSFEVNPGNDWSHYFHTGQWYHLTIVVDGSVIAENENSVAGRIYVNGKMIGSGSVVKDLMKSNDTKASIGVSPFDDPIKAGYDSLKVWNQVLSEEEILILYQAYLQ